MNVTQLSLGAVAAAGSGGRRVKRARARGAALEIRPFGQIGERRRRRQRDGGSARAGAAGVPVVRHFGLFTL